LLPIGGADVDGHGAAVLAVGDGNFVDAAAVSPTVIKRRRELRSQWAGEHRIHLTTGLTNRFMLRP